MNLKIWLFVTLVCLSANSMIASAEVEFLWEDTIPYWNSGISIDSDSNNNLFATWTAFSGLNIRKYDGYGNEVFTITNGGDYSKPDIDIGPNDSFLIVYNKNSDLYAQRYFSDGTPNGNSIFVASSGGKIAINPTNGDFLIVYRGCGGLCGKLYNASGSLLQEIQIYNGWVGGAREKSAFNVVSKYNGEYVVVLGSYFDSRYAVIAKEYYSNGTPKSDEFVVNNNQSASKDPTIATFSDGGVVIAWEDYRHDVNNPRVFAKIYNPDGTVKIEDFQVDSDIKNRDDYFGYIQVAIDPLNNDFAIIWVKAQAPSWDIHVVAQRYGYSGTLKDTITEVGDTSGNSQETDIAITPNHDIAISYMDSNPSIITKWRTMEGQRAIIQKQQSALDSISSNLARFEQSMQSTFGNPNFSINGATSEEKVKTLVDALINLSHGAKNGLYKLLGYK